MKTSFFEEQRLLNKDFFPQNEIKDNELLHSALNFYSEKEAIEISKNVLSNDIISHKNIDKESLDWLLQILGYCLQHIKDFDDYENILLKCTDIYCNWIVNFPIENASTEVTDFYITVFIFHLSQNISLLDKQNASKIANRLFQYIFNYKSGENKHLISIYVYFLVSCTKEMFKNINNDNKEAFKNICSKALYSIQQCNINEIDLNHIEAKLEEFYQNDIFISIFTDQFSSYYRSIVCNYNVQEDDPMTRFFCARIDKMSSKDKYGAFSGLIKQWANYILSSVNICCKKMPTALLWGMFRDWFSVEEAMSNISPLFELIRYGEKADISELEELAEQIITNIFTDKEVRHNIFPNFMCIIGHFLINNIEFAKKMTENIVKYLEECKMFLSDKGKTLTNEYAKEVSWILVILNMLCEANALNEDQIKSISNNLISFVQIDLDETVIAATFMYLLSKDNQMFWVFLNTVKMKGNRCLDFDLYSGLMFLVLQDPSFETGFVLEKKLMNAILLKDNKEDCMKTLLVLLALSLGTEYFTSKKNDNDMKDILKMISKDSDHKVVKTLFTILRTSILCRTNFAEIYKTDQGEEIEHYITNDKIVSIVGRNKLVVRHTLGTTIYNVEEAGQKSLQLENISFQSSFPEEKKTVESSLDGTNDPEELEIMRMNDIYHDFSSFSPYEPQKDPINESDVYSFLVDMGFMNYEVCDIIRRVSNDKDIKIIEELDSCQSRIVLECPIFHLINNSFVAEGSTKLEKMLLDLSSEGRSNTYYTPLVDINYDLKPFEGIEESANIAIVMNEDGSIINKSAKELREKLLLVATPIGDFYDIEMIICDGVKPTVIEISPFMPLNRHWVVKSTNLGKLIAIITLMFYSNKPKLLIGNFLSRYKIISGMFNRTEPNIPLSSFAKIRSTL